MINIYADLTKITLEKALIELAGKEYSFLKNKLSEALVEVICPVGKKMQEYLKDKGFLEKVLKDGTEKANKIAQDNLKEIRDTVGFL